ncbi:retinol dehydrogenase 11-like [Cylas formicarius]|uniref:retinol dehydrogenase 11-like n=1 Tax=Cylas formicarius TaxID=197179 RepID=UPI0029583703|nr:retinol dehydrogenase 11-like [Cylas formicarius]
MIDIFLLKAKRRSRSEFINKTRLALSVMDKVRFFFFSHDGALTSVICYRRFNRILTSKYEFSTMTHAFPFYAIPAVLFLILLRKYRESKWGRCTNRVKLDGKVALVTGANSGIGFEVAKELARRDAQVILACRTLDNARRASDKIKRQLDNAPGLIPMAVNLSSLKSVKDFAAEVKRDFSKLDLLVNNAGVAYPKGHKLETSDGFEVHFGVNHLGHFFLTNLLEPLLANAKGRVVVVASSLHEKGRLNLHDLNGSEAPPKENLYANSKLANVYFAQELARRTKEKGVKVYAVCPGWVYSALFRHFRWYFYVMVAPVAFFFMRNCKQGSETVVYCATEPKLDAETGLLYRDCAHYNSKTIFYDKVAKELWQRSQDMIDGVMSDNNHVQ